MTVTLSGVDAPTVAGIGVAQAWIEEKDPTITSPDLGWDRVGGLIMLTPGTVGLYRSWTGRLNLPRNGGRLRVVAQQFERFPADSQTGFVPMTVSRLVHTDIVEL